MLYMFQRAAPSSPGKKLDPWGTPEINAEFFALWSDLISQLKDEPAARPDRPIVVEGANYSHSEDLTAEFKIEDPDIIYAFHFYYPH